MCQVLKQHADIFADRDLRTFKGIDFAFFFN